MHETDTPLSSCLSNSQRLKSFEHEVPKLFSKYSIVSSAVVIATDLGRRKIYPSLSGYWDDHASQFLIFSTWEKLLKHLFPDQQNTILKSKNRVHSIRTLLTNSSKYYLIEGTHSMILIGKDEAIFAGALINATDKLISTSLNLKNDRERLLNAIWPRYEMELNNTESVADACSKLATLLKNDLQCDYDIFRYSPVSQKWDSINRSQSTIHGHKAYQKLKTSTYSGSLNGEPFKYIQYYHIAEHHHLWIPFIKSNEPSFLMFSIVLSSTKSIPSNLPYILRVFINRYFADVLPKKRNRITQKAFSIAQMESRKIIYNPSFGHKLFSSKFKSSFTEIFKEILNTTSAHAITYSAHDRKNQSLNTILQACAQHVTLKSDLDIETFSLRRNKNANVIAYKNCKRGEYEYRVIENQFEAATIPPSKEEVCFPVYLGSRPVATIWLSAPVTGAFKESIIRFLKSIVEAIEIYLENVYTINDSRWMRTRLILEDNIHEALGIIKNSKLTDTQKYEIDKLLRLNPITDDRARTLANLVDIIDDFYNQLRVDWDEDTLNKYINGTHVAGLVDSSLLLDPDRYGMIVVVLRNLLKNYIDHADGEDSRLTIWWSSKSQLLEIILLTPVCIEASKADKVGLVPIVEANNQIDQHDHTHSGLIRRGGSGLLLTGIACRALGGELLTEVSKKQGTTTFSALIPIES